MLFHLTFHFKVLFINWKRERARAPGKAQRKREEESQADSAMSTWSLTWGLIPRLWHHDLNETKSGTLNSLSHPGNPLHSLLFNKQVSCIPRSIQALSMLCTQHNPPCRVGTWVLADGGLLLPTQNTRKQSPWIHFSSIYVSDYFHWAAQMLPRQGDLEVTRTPCLDQNLSLRLLVFSFSLWIFPLTGYNIKIRA